MEALTYDDAIRLIGLIGFVRFCWDFNRKDFGMVVFALVYFTIGWLIS